MKTQKIISIQAPEASDRFLSPQDIEMIQEDPTRIEHVVRAMGAVNLENLFKHMQDPGISPVAKIEFQKVLNKMGSLEPEKKDAQTSGNNVVINITRRKDRVDEVVIESGVDSLAFDS